MNYLYNEIKLENLIFPHKRVCCFILKSRFLRCLFKYRNGPSFSTLFIKCDEEEKKKRRNSQWKYHFSCTIFQQNYGNIDTNISSFLRDLFSSVFGYYCLVDALCDDDNLATKEKGEKCKLLYFQQYCT